MEQPIGPAQLTIKAPRYKYNDPVTNISADFSPMPAGNRRNSGLNSSLGNVPRHQTKSMSPEPFVRSPAPMIG